MKKTIVICGVYPLPENTGTNIRTMNFIRFFKQVGSVEIAYIYPSPDGKIENTIFANEYVLQKDTYPKSFLGRFKAVLRGQPYPIRSYSKNAEEMLFSILESNNYDYIFVRYIENTYGLFKLPDKLKQRIIVDFDDMLSGTIYEEFFCDTKSLYKRMIRNFNRKALLIYEKKIIDLGVTIFCSEKDKRLSGNNPEKEFVVPNIYTNKTFEGHDFGNGSDNEKVLIFVGTLFYKPNVQGLKWFIETIYPKFRSQHHNAKLWVVGLSPNEEVKKMCNSSGGVDLFADVPDLRPYYMRSRVVVVPLLSGGGTRIKILEAILANRVVLSTPVGAEGLDLEHNKELLLFRSADEFIEMFNKTLDSSTYSSLTKSARKVATEIYSEENFVRAAHKAISGVDDSKLW